MSRDSDTDIKIVDFSFLGIEYRFAITDPNDTIQSHLRRGEYYEAIELRKLMDVMKGGLSILDVGANVGSHAVFFAKAMQASRVVCIEPFKEVADVLSKNIALNNCDNVDLKYLGLALSDRVGVGSLQTRFSGNAGSTFFSEMQSGDTPALPGDLIFQAEHFDLIKIDVEGMEFMVLAGLVDVISRSRPWIFIEISNDHLSDFTRWKADSGYSIVWRHKRYEENENFLVRPL